MFYPPTGEEIAEEAGLVMPGLESPALNPELPCLSSSRLLKNPAWPDSPDRTS